MGEFTRIERIDCCPECGSDAIEVADNCAECCECGLVFKYVPESCECPQIYENIRGLEE